jgi:2-polyprenyl-6-methoxyphenol hydroxylase-like FAD-dependent oxidoreductase
MTDVLVAGAGPTGLTLACALAARGVDVRVVDRAPGPARTSRANIRPDGHLGWRGRDRAALHRWLTAALQNGGTR